MMTISSSRSSIERKLHRAVTVRMTDYAEFLRVSKRNVDISPRQRQYVMLWSTPHKWWSTLRTIRWSLLCKWSHQSCSSPATIRPGVLLAMQNTNASFLRQSFCAVALKDDAFHIARLYGDTWRTMLLPV